MPLTSKEFIVALTLSKLQGQRKHKHKNTEKITKAIYLLKLTTQSKNNLSNQLHKNKTKKEKKTNKY